MADEFTYDVATDRGRVRLLLNDVDEATRVFWDAEIDAFLALEGGTVKLAAAQAIDTNADNEALASKVITTQDLSTDGAKVADVMHKRAAALRAQAADELVDAEAGGAFVLVQPGLRRRRYPELTEHPPYCPPYL